MKHCLILDDSDVIRKVVRRMLERAHFRVSEAADAREALERCVPSQPDLILVDWHMPAMGGTEFISALRHTEIGQRPYTIYCTTEYDPVDIVRAFEAGADNYLMKPFTRAELMTVVFEAGLG